MKKRVYLYHSMKVIHKFLVILSGQSIFLKIQEGLEHFIVLETLPILGYLIITESIYEIYIADSLQDALSFLKENRESE